MKAVAVELVGILHASTATKLEEVLRHKPGVLFARIEFAARQATVHYDEHLLSESTLRALIREWGYGDPIRAGERSARLDFRYAEYS